MENKKRGGARPGAGRPAPVKGLNKPIAVRLSDEAAEILSTKPNKSAYINELILKYK